MLFHELCKPGSPTFGYVVGCTENREIDFAVPGTEQRGQCPHIVRAEFSGSGKRHDPE